MEYFKIRITTEEEREKIALMLADIFKDIVYINALRKARELVKSIFDFNMQKIEEYKINYTFEITNEMLNTFLGKIRRKKEKE